MSMGKCSESKSKIENIVFCRAHKAYHRKNIVMETCYILRKKGISETVKNGKKSSKASCLFPCSSKSYYNFRVSSTRFSMNLFLIKTCTLLLCDYCYPLQMQD